MSIVVSLRDREIAWLRERICASDGPEAAAILEKLAARGLEAAVLCQDRALEVLGPYQDDPRLALGRAWVAAQGHGKAA